MRQGGGGAGAQPVRACAVQVAPLPQWTRARALACSCFVCLLTAVPPSVARPPPPPPRGSCRTPSGARTRPPPWPLRLLIRCLPPTPYPLSCPALPTRGTARLDGGAAGQGGHCRGGVLPPERRAGRRVRQRAPYGAAGRQGAGGVVIVSLCGIERAWLPAALGRWLRGILCKKVDCVANDVKATHQLGRDRTAGTVRATNSAPRKEGDSARRAHCAIAGFVSSIRCPSRSPYSSPSLSFTRRARRTPGTAKWRRWSCALGGRPLRPSRRTCRDHAHRVPSWATQPSGTAPCLACRGRLSAWGKARSPAARARL